MAKNSTKPKDKATPATEEEQVSATPATEDEGNAAPVTEEDSFAGTHMVNTVRGLNLREAPSYGAPVLEVLPCGTSVEDIDPEGAPAGWLHVVTEGGTGGFVAAKYVSPVKE